MGRIKSTLVKRTAKQLLIKSDMKYDETFETNKKILGSTMPSKKIRNKIAGYMARLNRMKKDAANKPVVKRVPEGMSETPDYQFT